MKTIQRDREPAVEARLRRDLGALADQLIEHDALDTEPEWYDASAPFRRRTRRPAVAAAAAVVALVAAGAVLTSGGEGPTARTDSLADTRTNSATDDSLADDPNARLAVAVEELEGAWSAAFPPDAVIEARAAQDETSRSAREVLGDYLERLDPAATDLARPVPETVCGCWAEGRLADGEELEVSVLSLVEPADDLAWVDTWVADSTYQRVPIPDEDVQVWATTAPVDADSGRGYTSIEAFTVNGILAITYEHVGAVPTVDPATAAGIARTVFTLG